MREREDELSIGDEVDQQQMSPRFARSRRMVQCLRQHRLYSEKRARDMLFEATEKLVSTQAERALVAHLPREAARMARQQAADVGYQFPNWTAASAAVTKTLLCSGSVLSTQREPIGFDVRSYAEPIGALRDDYRDRAEAFLLQVLLEQLGDVTLRDHTALAHALFRQFDPNVPMADQEDRVAILLARLADRIVITDDVYVVCQPTASRSG